MQEQLIVAITETTPQLHKHIMKFKSLHPEIKNDDSVMELAIRERYGDVNVAAVIYQAEKNWMLEDQRRLLSDPATNPFIKTTIQGDLFNDLPPGMKVPREMVIDGLVKAYWEVTPEQVAQWWKDRRAAKKSEREAFEASAARAGQQEREADEQVAMHEHALETARINGIDPTTLRYAKQDEA